MRALDWKMLINFRTIWYILCLFGTYCPVLVSCTKKNLEALLSDLCYKLSKPPKKSSEKSNATYFEAIVTGVARFLLVKHTKRGKNIPYDEIIHKIYPMAVKQTKWPQNIPTSSIVRPFKIYPNWDFWFENMPSGNPVRNKEVFGASGISRDAPLR
jgi:hypothetical protein